MCVSRIFYFHIISTNSVSIRDRYKCITGGGNCGSNSVSRFIFHFFYITVPLYGKSIMY